MVQVSGAVPLGSATRTRASLAYHHYTDPSVIIDENRGNAAVDTSGSGTPDEKWTAH